MIIFRDKDVVVILGLLMVWLLGLLLSAGNGGLIPGYTLDKKYAYICSQCGGRVLKKQVHTKEECENYHKPKPQAAHFLNIGSEKYVKDPPFILGGKQ